MAADLVIALIVNPVTNALITTTDRKLVELEFDMYVCAPVFTLCEAIVRDMSLDFAIIFLRKVWQLRLASSGLQALLLFEVDSRSSKDLTLPIGLTWTPRHDALSVSGQRTPSSVSDFLVEFSKLGVHINSDRLYPYSRAGWFKTAREWMSLKLKTYRNEEVVTVRQLTLNTQGSVLCATTRSKRKYYMKAIPPEEMNDEVAVSCAIARVFPDKYPKPIAVDVTKRYIVMSNYGVSLAYGDCFVNSRRGRQLMRKILLEWSVVQKRAIARKNDLVQLGVPVLNGSHVMQEVRKMMEDPVWYDMQKKGMNEAELLQFGEESEYKQNYAAYIKRLLRELARFEVPFSLVHGDLNPVNVVLRDDNTCLFFDFALTCISAPFIDAIRFVNVCEGSKEDLGFYLEQWTEFESMDRLWNLLDVVDDLDGVLTLLILYHAYRTSEQVLRDTAREELIFGVWDTFNKYL